jgi:hypothetical protein
MYFRELASAAIRVSGPKHQRSWLVNIALSSMANPQREASTEGPIVVVTGTQNLVKRVA